MNLFEMVVQTCEMTVAGGDELHCQLWLVLSRLATMVHSTLCSRPWAFVILLEVRGYDLHPSMAFDMELYLPVP